MLLLLAVALMSPHAYTVQSGDTLSAIAQHELGSAGRWPSLCAANGIKNCDLIFPGQRLTLNLARVPARAAERVTRPVKPSRFVGGGTLGYQGLEGLWEAAGGPSWAAPTAACIAEHESGGRQYATGPVGERGYWQINPAAWPPSMATYNPYGNARAAVKISNYGRDWSAWTTAPMCGV